MTEAQKKDSVLFCVNGIWNDPDNVMAWTDRAEDYCENRGIRCKRFEPETNWTFRRMPWHLGKYANMAALMFQTTSQQRRFVLAHSFGCEIVLRAVDLSGLDFEVVILVQGAVTSDCARNRINHLLATNRVKRFVVTWSQNDSMLKLARFWPPWDFVLRPLGLVGPRNVAIELRTGAIQWHQHRHSTMWHGDNFHGTMNMVFDECGFTA